jgi:uncharacterized hydrophobic protein (TIGR00271 family)
MAYRLIYDKEQHQFAEQKIIPLFEDDTILKEAYSTGTLNDVKKEDQLLLYLSDHQLKDLLPRLAGSGIIVAILPHPDAREACLGMGVDRSLSNAIKHILKGQTPIKTDLLFCNGMPVFNNMVVGQTFKLSSEGMSDPGGFLKRKLRLLARFFNIKPFRVDVDLTNEKHIKTSVAGIVVSEHRKSSLLSRLLLDDSSVSDGKMHAFFVSPRSVAGMIRFFVSSLWKTNRLPSFGAHIKTSQITITFPGGPRDVLIDNEVSRTEKLEFQVGKKQIDIIPGAYLKLPESSNQSAEIFKISALPTGETAHVLSEHKLPLIRHASTEEFKDLFMVLRDSARTKNSYLVLMVLSTVLATFGLFANSSPVVIGAMILAPLMSPIISLSMGTLRQDKKLITTSISTIMAGLALAFLFTVFLTWLTPIETAGSEIMARTRPNLLDLGIAVVSGIAGAYAHAREEVAKTLAGVAIAVALIPPLAVAGIGLGWADWSIFGGAVLLLGTNLAGMVLAAALTFMFLGFSPLRLAGKGMLISLVLVLLLSIPLALGFKQMVQEHKIIKQLEGLETEFAIIRDVKVEELSPVKISLKLVSEGPAGDADIEIIKQLIEYKVKRKVEIEVVTAISRK